MLSFKLNPEKPPARLGERVLPFAPVVWDAVCESADPPGMFRLKLEVVFTLAQVRPDERSAPRFRIGCRNARFTVTVQRGTLSNPQGNTAFEVEYSRTEGGSDAVKFGSEKRAVLEAGARKDTTAKWKGVEYPIAVAASSTRVVWSVSLAGKHVVRNFLYGNVPLTVVCQAAEDTVSGSIESDSLVPCFFDSDETEFGELKAAAMKLVWGAHVARQAGVRGWKYDFEARSA